MDLLPIVVHSLKNHILSVYMLKYSLSLFAFIRERAGSDGGGVMEGGIKTEHSESNLLLLCNDWQD